MAKKVEDLVTTITGNWVDTKGIVEELRKGMSDYMRTYISAQAENERDDSVSVWIANPTNLDRFLFSIEELIRGFERIEKERQEQN